MNTANEESDLDLTSEIGFRGAFAIKPPQPRVTKYVVSNHAKEGTMSLDKPVAIRKPPSHLGKIRLIIDDYDGTKRSRVYRANVSVMNDDGDRVAGAQGDPFSLMPLNWRQSMTAAIEELRAELASRQTVQPTRE